MKRPRRLRSFSLYQKVVAGILSGLLPLTTLPDLALALPHGGVVAKGQATLGYATGRLLVTQSTSSATFNWGSFNVTAGQSVVYKTPGSSSVSMNYIGGTTPSSIDGRVTSNGILYFMNPNGLIFGSGSVVSAAGVMAFGSATPWGKPTGAVSNAGVLTATDNGTVALVGSSVTNTGTITAPGGEVLLAAGSTVTPISATEGSSLSVATTGGGLVDDSGILSAETTNGKTGTVLLQSGMETGTTTLASTAVLDASAPNGGNGGKVFINGSGVVLNNIEPINVSASYGAKGTVRIDPNYILSGTTLDICNAAGLEYLDGNQSSYLADTIILESNMNLGGSYGWTPLGTSFSSAFTGTFNGNGHVVSGYTIGTLSNPYSGNDTGFIGYLSSTGTVKNLGMSGTIYASSNDVGGVVGANFGTVETSSNTGSVTGHRYVGGVVGVNGGTLEYSYNTGSVSGSGNDVGGVVGFNYSNVESSYNTGSVTGSHCVGGVVGDNTGMLKTSYNTGNVSGNDVGGVVGYNNGRAIVENSYNTGSVIGSGNDVGGVVGDNTGTVTDTYYNNTTFKGLGIGVGPGSATGLSEGTICSGNLGYSGSYFGWSFASGWNGTGFGTPGTWMIGTVYPNGGTSEISAPILVSDLPTATVKGNSGTSVYSGSAVSPDYTATYTMGGNTLPSGITVTTSSAGPNAGTYTITPTVTGTFAQPTTQTSVDSVSAVSGTWTITPATLTVTANSTTMTYGGTVPTLSGSVTGLVGGQTLAGDGMTVSWSTTATSSSNVGTYQIIGKVSVSVGLPYSGDYKLTQASGNATALTITPAPSTSGSSGSLSTGSPSGGSGTPGGITSTHFAPVAQTAALTLSGPGTSISGNSSDSGGSSSSTSEDSITLSSGSGTSLSVVSTGGGDLTGDGILSSQEVKP